MSAKYRERLYGGRSVAQTDNEEPQVEAVSVNSTESKPYHHRDIVTGRKLVEDGGSCLRCVEKGLKCTLNFVGVGGATQCAACTRSKTPHCIRKRPVGRRIIYVGPPWKSRNYFSIGEPLSEEELEETLKEHFQGREGYYRGMYLPGGDQKKLALPPFNGSDRPISQRPDDWETMDWRGFLPIPINQSYHTRLLQLEEKNTTSPSSSSFSPKTSPPETSPSPSSESASVSSKVLPTASPQGTDSDDEPLKNEDILEHMVHYRKYQRRMIHLREYQKELEETH
ncbi:hypothetical protein F4821DRAFT_253834 [Hypoxylon rubiginosum]|uniref:Uncharacterized protein n=1 Tax=Hypoxylon rubiginosum TaxID=110542 RepID=A0ACC0DHV0_9PEZI|nr:hypothetical protein F4821DRAFT_253834 [Hypoxylon rubiginosum]